MNKILLTIAAAGFSFSANATDLTILNTGSKSGSYAGLTTALSSDFTGSDFQNPGKHCVAINSNLKSITTPVLFPWANDLEAAGRDGDGCATVNITKDEVLGYTSSPLHVCAMDDKDFLKTSGKVGHSHQIGCMLLLEELYLPLLLGHYHLNPGMILYSYYRIHLQQ